ncbi:MAG: hypothetical protein ACR2PL_11465 [Dehalococcoidia bacterium]
MERSNLLPLLAGLVLLILGTGVGYAIGAGQSHQPSLSRSLCDDALSRRRQAEQAQVVAPLAGGTSDSQSLVDQKLDEARQLAQGFRAAADRDVSKYCK